MTVDVYRSTNFPRTETKNINLSEIKAGIQRRIDVLVEYPGSSKSIDGQGGWWRFQEWATHKIDHSLKKRGERV